MKNGDIVFAPFKDSSWPGRVLALGTMADVKFFKIKEPFKVPSKSLVPFTVVNMASYLAKNTDKAFRVAVKMAESELKKTERRESVPKKEVAEKVPIIKIEEGLLQEVKAEEGEKEEVKALPEHDSLLSLYLETNEEELIKLARETSSHEFVFFNTESREKKSYVKNPELELARLTEFMLARLLCETHTKTIQTYQRKLTTILGTFSFSIPILLNRDVTKLIRIVREYHECTVLKWKSTNFISQLVEYQEKAKI